MKILVPISGSRNSLTAVRHAARIARDRDAEIVLLNVQPALTSYAAKHTSREAREAMRNERAEAALDGSRRLSETLGVRWRALTAVGPVADTVVSVARELRVDQMVLATSPQAGWWQALVSPVGNILDSTEVPVVLVSGERPGVLKRYGLPASVGLGLSALIFALD